MPDRVRLNIPSEPRALSLVEATCERYGEMLELPPDEASTLRRLVCDAVRFTLEHAYPNDPSGQVEISLDLASGAVHVDVHDWGRPIAAGGDGVGALPPGLAELAGEAHDLRLLNLGIDGKRITFGLPVSAALDTGPDAHEYESPPEPPAGEDLRERLEIRPAGPEDAEAISQLLYANYHLSYGHPDFYRPRWVADELAEGRLVSTLAVLEGEIVGHHAVMLEEGSASAETGASVVHPAFRGLGIFTKLANESLRRSMELGLDALWGRALTVHPYSQRAARARGYRETGLMLGHVPARMEIEGIEGAQAGKRTASILVLRPLRPSPRAPVLPARYENLLREAYANAGLELEPDAEPAPPPAEPIAVTEEASRNSALIRVCAWEEKAVVHALRQELARHHDVIYVDLDLSTGAATADALELLNREGFFYAGLVACGMHGHDYVRLQLLNTENIELERIICDSEAARRLLEAVRADRARVEA